MHRIQKILWNMGFNYIASLRLLESPAATLIVWQEAMLPIEATNRNYFFIQKYLRNLPGNSEKHF
ncbi:MAG TPA: hypothetical protein HA261_00045 [Methanosarcina sp.]|nr:hypothetical protein [Methanosarcina sp.]